MNIHYFGKTELKEKAAEMLNDRFKDIKGTPTLFLSSGGSSLELLDLIDTSLFDKHSTITMLDERYSTDPKINNFAQLIETKFYKETKANGAHFIETQILPDESITEAASRIEKSLKEWRHTFPNGHAIATVGIGPDGHTSGMMPYPENKETFQKLFQDGSWVTGYDAQGKNEYSLRITVTMTFLFSQLEYALSYLSGENKKTALERVLSEEGTLYSTPGRAIRELREADLVTDIAR